jgi:ribonucleotide reductase alpha subunit
MVQFPFHIKYILFYITKKLKQDYTKYNNYNHYRNHYPPLSSIKTIK